MRIQSKSQKTYFRARPSAVAARIDLKLRHDVVHHAADALTIYRDFRRSGERFSMVGPKTAFQAS